MLPKLEIQEIAIALATKPHNPTILTPDFLRYSGIVPADWELARQPICTNSLSQIMFQNGVSIVAQVDRVVFAEAMSAKNVQDIKISKLACEYVQTLPNIDYWAVGINPRGYVAFSDEEAVQNYLTFTLLSPGTWQEFGQAPVKASLNLAYSLTGRLLNLSINPATLQLPEQREVSVVLFSGNFHYNLTGDMKQQQLCEIIDNWQWDLKTYREIVDTGFLQLSSVLNLEERLQIMDDGNSRELMDVSDQLPHNTNSLVFPNSEN